MSSDDLILLLAGLGILIALWHLYKIKSSMSAITAKLESLDNEAFHIAQELNPSYGRCDECGSRTNVRHVTPKNSISSSTAQELFYCKACWYMSNTVDLSDEEKFYKDRTSSRDKLAAHIGPK